MKIQWRHDYSPWQEWVEYTPITGNYITPIFINRDEALKYLADNYMPEYTYRLYQDPTSNPASYKFWAENLCYATIFKHLTPR
jgi:hypothetical protein